MCIGAELLGQVVMLFNGFKTFFERAASFCIPTHDVCGLVSPHPHQHLILFVFCAVVVICHLAVLVGVTWDRTESEVTLRMEARGPGFLGGQGSCGRAGAFLRRDRNAPLCCGSTRLPEPCAKAGFH